MRNVVFFSSNISRVATNQDDLLSRFQGYAQKAEKVLRSNFECVHLLIGGVYQINRIESMNNIKIAVLSRFIPAQYIALRIYLKSLKGQTTLISGDNHLSLLICLLVKCRNSDIRLQISIHTSVCALLNSANIAEKLKLKFLLLNIRFIDSIRVVSNSDLENLQKVIPYYKGEIFVAPVPIEIPKTALDRKLSNIVAMVGRLHSERGIEECPAIFKELRVVRPESKIMLIGDGPERAWLEIQLDDFEPKPEFTGSLKQSDIQDKWSEIHVLLSCAPSESYGMALREALVNGVFVVARKNETTELLQAQFPSVMKVFASTSEAAVFINGFFNQVFSPNDVLAVRQAIKSEQDRDLAKLAKSWFV